MTDSYATMLLSITVGLVLGLAFVQVARELLGTTHDEAAGGNP